MNFVKLELDVSYGNYSYHGASNTAMGIIGLFLIDDVGCADTGYPTYKDWALNDSLGMGVSGNITALEKEGGYIYLTDSCSVEDIPTEVKMTRQQFISLLDDWRDKVCKAKPKEVIIKHDGSKFTIETKE